ncbi:MAG TPA: hypothetical protein VIE69_00335 [Methylophilaceae bacterium]
MSSEKRVVASAWHPQPMRELIHLNHCDVRVLAGEAGYQLSTGEIVRVN